MGLGPAAKWLHSANPFQLLTLLEQIAQRDARRKEDRIRRTYQLI